ncbi:InlB B-repeat-containing protein [Candidatus Saccharibacteria bacterium]|nr:InlB B-repeat-containing protein [Candidatus Saccharibacteria bacterium]
MDGGITVHVVEPGSNSTVPNTGLFLGGSGDTLLLSAILVLVILIQLPIFIYTKKRGKTIRFSRFFTTKASVIPVLISLFALTTLVVTNINADDTEESDSLVTAENADLTIELGDEPVFAYVPVSIKFKEATSAGYSISSYAKTTKLTKEGSDEAISLIAPTDEPSSLTNNTWGFALTQPSSENDATFVALPETEEDALAVKSTGYTETPAGDETIVYYGIYVTPDLPYGTYSGLVISYEAEENAVTTVTFNGNGLYFDGNEEQTTNTVKYIPGNRSETVYLHTPNLNDEGVQDGRYGTDLNITAVYGGSEYSNTYFHIYKGSGDTPWPPSNDYFSIWSGDHPDYTASANWDNEDSIKEFDSNGKYIFDRKINDKTLYIPSGTITFAYTTDSDSGCCGGDGYGYYAKTVSYNPNVSTSGTYKEPSSILSHKLIGWDENPNATTPTYANQKDVEGILDLSNGDVTLYAIWKRGIEVVYNGNGANAGTDMDQIKQYGYSMDLATAGFKIDLIAPNFKKDGHGFVGWSTDAEAWEHLTDNDNSNDPTIYGPSQTVAVDEDVISQLNEKGELVLNAIWAPVEKDNNGNPIALQNWTGCSNLTATTFDSSTNTLTVSKNTITALQDIRDGNVYTVARLADGGCWMTENLRLSNGTELSVNNTNNPSLPITNSYAEQTVSNYLSSTSDSWCTGWDDASCYDQSMLNTNNTTQTISSPVYTEDLSNGREALNENIVSYGNYYNWYSATAGNGKQEHGRYVYANGDICPAGWQLPNGGSEEGTRGNLRGGFYYLHNLMGGNNEAQGSSNWRSFPNNFVYSGIWYENAPDSRGGAGYYWSSTPYWTTSAYNLALSSYWINAGSQAHSKAFGSAVRCTIPMRAMIVYDGNGADSTTNMDGVKQYTSDVESTEKQVDLLASNFTKAGHGFVGWSEDADAWEHLQDDNEANNPTIYGPNQTITIDPSNTGVMRLYAIWVPAEKDNSSNPIALQNWTGCSNLTATTFNNGILTVGKNTITALTDTRDNNIYTIARLADGNCWMTENLRLDDSVELSSTHTNNPALPLTNSYADQTTSNHLSSSSDFSEWCYSDTTDCIEQSMLNTQNTAHTTVSPAFSQEFTYNRHANFNDSVASYGNYYNKYSANAGNIYNQWIQNGDICPTGWRLPTGYQTDENGSFSRLDVIMGGNGDNQQSSFEASNNWRSFPNNFIYAGKIINDQNSWRGEIGAYWGSNSVSYMGLTKDGVELNFASWSHRGMSVRCINTVE